MNMELALIELETDFVVVQEDLYKAGRTAFIVSSEKALKQHINEFVDHALVRESNGGGGKLCYKCLLPTDTMQSILAEPAPPTR